MAAAVEGTPRRVRSLLSSFLHVSGKDDELRTQQDDSVSESISRSQPRSKEAFWNRVETFSPFTWFAKPHALSPLHCARFGWENSEVDILQCVSCKACLDATTSTTWDPDMYAKTCEQLKEALITGHSKLCPWSDNPCPECFIKLPVYSYSQWLEDYKMRWRSIVALVDEIPLVEPQAISDMDCLTEGHIKGLQNLVDPESVCWTSNEIELEKASRAACIIALCGWEGRSGSDPEVHTISCSLCRRELGVWNFFALMHAVSDEQMGHEAPSYLDTGQMWDESEASEQDLIQKQASGCGLRPSDQQQIMGGSADSDTGGDSDSRVDESDQTEPMEESRSVHMDQASQSSSMDDTEMYGLMSEEGTRGKDSIEKGRTYQKRLTNALEEVGLKSPLHRSLLDIPGEEATESLCVEVEDESLSERLQAVESELEFLGCSKEGSMVSDREDGGPRAKRRRLQEVEKSTFHVLSEHRSWCPWVVTVSGSTDDSTPAGWKLLLGMLLPSMSPTATLPIHETPPQDAWKTVRKLLTDCYSTARPTEQGD